MIKPIGRSRGSFFWKNLGLVLLITCIPIAFIGIILYYIGTSRIEAEVNRAHQNQLNLSIQQMNDYLTNLEHSVVRLAFDRSMDEMLKNMDLIQEFSKTNEFMKSFSLITESNSLIDSVSLYLRDADKLLGDEVGFQSIRMDEDRKLLESLLEKERTIYWNYSLKKINKPNSKNKAIIIKLPGGQMYGSYGAFIIYLDQDKLNTMVYKLVSGEGVAFLFNENGDYLTTPRNNEPTPDQLSLEDALKNQIMKENFNDHLFKYEWRNQIYTVSYGKIAKLGSKWTVVSATPLSQITAPVTFLSRLILWISMVGLTIGLLLSWFASNKMYAPIYRLKNLFEASRNNRSEEKDEIIYIENQWRQHLKEQQALDMRIKQSIPALRESFLLQFLQGNLYTHTESEIINKMKQLDWDVENKRFAVMVAQLHGLSDLGGKFTERDAQLITFAASNIILELCSEKLKLVHVTNFQDLSVGIFFALDNSFTNEEIKGLLNKLAHDYIVSVNNVLRLRITIVMGKISDSIVEIPNVLDQTRKALRFRDLHTTNQMLDMNQFMIENTSLKHFPSELERDIVHAVNMGLEEEAVRLIQQFMIELQSNNSTELMVHQGMMKLLGTLHDTIIKHDVNLYTLYEGIHLYEQLMQISEPDPIVDWFQYKLIRPFIKTLTIAYDSNMRETMNKLHGQIQQEILLDISLEMYADQLQMSSSKLSKAFRQINGINFIDFIIRLRIEKCKELLVTTDMKINDIAGLLHYQPSHLIRIFKKSEGITPRQYREKHTQGNPSDSSA
ncbi:helix-turn-helix domain-containing protein [Paenibacillus sp. LMG 31456]|uniref:Helix-turn-helix domain-containing protein n=1 Tax=Paenibacillus foliorum TaxID=2654974 RepID=A0A972K0L1_9BACL|nr:helix-turn-helix domain-containing protein [Paenibacillus foliorum]NOU93940.1 helix-turn-helix domain-containing protein [Paenibacillus foliorum]